MINFKEGQEVVCVSGGPWVEEKVVWFIKWDALTDGPEKDEIVTVKAMLMEECLRLELYEYEGNYPARCFQPILSDLQVSEALNEMRNF